MNARTLNYTMTLKGEITMDKTVLMQQISETYVSIYVRIAGHYPPLMYSSVYTYVHQCMHVCLCASDATI